MKQTKYLLLVTESSSVIKAGAHYHCVQNSVRNNHKQGLKLDKLFYVITLFFCTKFKNRKSLTVSEHR